MVTNDTENEENDDVPLPETGVKKKVIVYLIAAIIIIGIGVGAAITFFSRVNKSSAPAYDMVTQKGADGAEDSSIIFYSLPDFSADLRTSSGVSQNVKIKINLELSSADDITTINTMLPRINDIIISHLTELTTEEISGSEGFYALKTELLQRINLMISPVKVLNLNIKDLNIRITDALEKKED